MPDSMTVRQPTILVFDSGVGGLSILAELQVKMPHAHYIYLADNEAFPYGTKSESELISRVNLVLHQALLLYSIDMIVVACNSASTIALPHIRSLFSLPIIGVVPAIKPAAALTQTKVIGLLATPGTVSRQYTQNLIEEFAPHCDVICQGSSALVQMAENKLQGIAPHQQMITQELGQLLTNPKAQTMDTLILACTHFPLLKDEIQAQFNHPLTIIDSGEAIARRALHIATELATNTEPANSGIALFTAIDTRTRQLSATLLTYGLHQHHLLVI